MPFIILIVVVIVALVFLIVFNLAVSRKSRTRGSRPMPTRSDEAAPARQIAPVLDSKSAQQAVSDTVIAGAIPSRAGGEGNNVDHSYRQALRSFKQEPAKKAPKSGRKMKTSDNEYREAIRSLDKNDP